MSDVVKRNLITRQQAMARLCVCQSQLYVLTAEGKLKAYKHGQKTLWDADTVDAFNASLPPVVLRTKRAKPLAQRETTAA